jgi:hypothetical protein
MKELRPDTGAPRRQPHTPTNPSGQLRVIRDSQGSRRPGCAPPPRVSCGTQTIGHAPRKGEAGARPKLVELVGFAHNVPPPSRRPVLGHAHRNRASRAAADVLLTVLMRHLQPKSVGQGVSEGLQLLGYVGIAPVPELGGESAGDHAIVILALRAPPIDHALRSVPRATQRIDEVARADRASHERLRLIPAIHGGE